ncbi:XtrA/YqaO family protein [Priestia megaterium]|uniref:XtrA/YqaO family protein n=1 Tax=Priestia megaterium TaxID=1404 RepID=UPI00244661F4|nr:XtrA/YqaO family protein [Priestia megaterium]WRQ94724.1 XtrA/YqaO family protein [Priestia megaterium]
MAKRAHFLPINSDMTVTYPIEPGKVTVLILDGHQGRVKSFNAVEHGLTIVETIKGRVAKVKFEESELF